jgi:predicted AlkP superfamily pyrophosphatase or phosphodiesterase
MKRLLLFVFALQFAATASAEPNRPVPQIERVVIISVDGLRPDLLLRAEAPNMQSLYTSGSFSFWARTTAVAVTLPSHVSMLTGVSPNRHGISWNSDLSFTEPVYPRVPTVLELARQAGYRTAVATGKSKFSFINKPGTIDHGFFPDDPKTTDVTVAESAASILREHRPQMMFVHFPDTDSAGHAKGWGTPHQMEAVEKADAAVGIVLAALRELELMDSTLIILTADHGGAGRTHGPDDPRSRTIPWIITGPGIRKHYDLTVLAQLEINTEDTAATAMHFLGLTPTVQLDGKPILEVLEERELLSDAPVPSAPPRVAAP